MQKRNQSVIVQSGRAPETRSITLSQLWSRTTLGHPTFTDRKKEVTWEDYDAVQMDEVKQARE